MSTKNIVICDVCGDEYNPLVDPIYNRKLPVVFITEINEGKVTNPYLIDMKLDICYQCLEYMTINRELITGSGAQGYYEYWFANRAEEKKKDPDGLEFS